AIIIPNFNSYAVQHNLPFEIQFEDSESAAAHIGKSYILRFMTVSSATRKLKGELDVNMLGKGSDLLELSHTGQSKLRSQSILNSVVGVFDQDGISDRQKVSKRTIDFIDERFVSLAKELDSIEVDIKDFKKTNDFIDIESDAQLNLTQRTMSEGQVFDVENQLMITDILEETIQDQQSTSELLPTNIGVGDANINGLIGQFNDLVFERNKLGVSGGSNNPTVRILDNKLNDVQQNIYASIDAYKSQLNATKLQLTKRNQKFAFQVSGLPLKEKLLRSRIRQQEIKQTLYLFLLQKREEAAINLAITEPSIKVVEYALSNGTPISPNSSNIYLTALLLGLVTPFGAIYGINLLNTKIKGKEDVVSSVGTIPILAELPKIKGGNLVFDNPTDRSVQSEAFRILSANVDYILPITDNSEGKVIYCTSTIKGEGKTYVGINLSLALSSINKKVLLVGADLRNPQIHTYIDKDKKVAGLSNYLYDDTIDWKDMLLKGFEKHPNHQILLSGDIPPNPTQLLTNGRFKAFLDEAKGLYDYVIIDTAPTILVTDTLLISKHADATIYLVRADHTEKNLLEFSRNLSDSGKIKNMAYVINGVGASRSYGYSYNYGYGYGYGSKD
ncbi:GumC family protein, partial [Psychroserpens sp.]|uniref:GumC family protein n=1 Tax=Psychroserpens sp. TaxID=2020870 RepID=UPI003C70C48A